MTEEEKLNEMSGALATESIEEEPAAPIESDNPVQSDQSGQSDQSDKSDKSDGSDGSEPEKTAAERELEDLTGRMGAEGILEIIRGNRNMIIEQLIAEAKAKQGRRPMPSGISGAGNAHSIFDIAALA